MGSVSSCCLPSLRRWAGRSSWVAWAAPLRLVARHPARSRSTSTVRRFFCLSPRQLTGAWQSFCWTRPLRSCVSAPKADAPTSQCAVRAAMVSVAFFPCCHKGASGLPRRVVAAGPHATHRPRAGINGYLCRPSDEVWCEGCLTSTTAPSTTSGPTTTTTTTTTTTGAPTSAPPCFNDCTRCVFAGPTNNTLCVRVNSEQWVGYQVGVLGATSDKIISLNVISAFTKSWTDAMSAVADASGAQSLFLQSSAGVQIAPLPSALNQTQYVHSLLSVLILLILLAGWVHVLARTKSCRLTSCFE